MRCKNGRADLSDPIDLDAERERRKRLEMYACTCGSGIFRLWRDGEVECLNCGYLIGGLKVTEVE